MNDFLVACTLVRNNERYLLLSNSSFCDDENVPYEMWIVQLRDSILILISFQLTLNSHMWLVPTILEE